MYKMTEDFFVQIRDSREVRKALLGTSKQLIDILKRYEVFRGIRVAKMEQIAKLRLINKEINLLTNKLKKEFPVAKVRVKMGKQAPRSKVERVEFGTDDLDDLERQLKEVESKIARIN